ncbi:hypothetical protein N7G274_000117 [Stereocaulon virgatum]|uniref:Alb1-domain-containing protein n=1 Tax=Stereocaulon virgatum TaxID=373712 RepID=A0ABR4ARM8_9LECA
MAKTAKLKKSNKSPSTHSRASRRASSPSLNLDKSLTSLKAPSRTKSNFLAPHANDGVTKSKKKGGKILKRKQKLRSEQGREKAEAVMEKMEKKVERAGERREGMKGRNANWDELNDKIAGRKGRRKMATTTDDNEDDGWGNEEMATGTGVPGEKHGVGVENRVDTGGIMDDEIF